MKDYDSLYFSRFSVDPETDISELYGLDEYNFLEAEMADDLETDIFADTGGCEDLSEIP